VIIYVAMQIPAVAGDGLVSDNQFNGVLVKVVDNRWEHNRLHGLLIDVTIFHFLKQNGQQNGLVA
jgi:hypothetical protein